MTFGPGVSKVLDFLRLLIKHWVLESHVLFSKFFVDQLVDDAKHILWWSEQVHLMHLQLRLQIRYYTVFFPQFVLHLALQVPHLLLLLFDDPIHLHNCVLILQFLKLTLLQFVRQFFGF